MIPPMPAAWSTVAREYARSILPGFRPAARALCEFAGISAGDRVLDIACGPGTAAMEARALGATEVTGVDYAEGMLAVARELTAGQTGFTFLEGNALDLPVPDGAFDVAISNFGVIFAPDPERAVREMARAVRPGGRAALTAWLESDVTREYYDLVYQHVPRHPAPHDPYDWGVPARAVAWLGREFTGIQTRPLAVPFEAESVGGAWEILNRSTGRVAAGYATLSPEARRAFDEAMFGYFERFRRDDGTVFWPREALLVRGRRPVPRSGAAGEIFI
jgi:SAM-dependent methyltransferase